jgi:hypothetical protein
MKLAISAAAAAALTLAATTLVATSALAADHLVTAKLAAPLKARVMPVAGGSVFTCEGDTCTASEGADTNTVHACRDLAHVVGALTSFGTAARPLSAAKLAACNTSARK